MTRQEAEQQAVAHNRDHPDRATHRWVARESGGAWAVARIALPPGMRLDPLNATVETRPEPRDAPDPRPSFDQNVGGPYAT